MRHRTRCAKIYSAQKLANDIEYDIFKRTKIYAIKVAASNKKVTWSVLFLVKVGNLDDTC